jgi:predicted transposase YdaD
VEIETYPDADADRQVFDDLMLIAVDRRVVPEVIALVLKPKGNLTVTGAANRVSVRGGTRMSGSWPVVRLWELDADQLLAAGDAGLIPWVPLTRTALPPDELMARCHERLVQVPDPNDRAGLLAVTQLLAGLAFPDRRFFKLFGGSQMFDSPVFEEVKEMLRAHIEKEVLQEGLQQGLQQGLQKGLQEGRQKGLQEGRQEGLQEGRQEGLQEGRQEATRKAIRTVLEFRFGSVPAERVAPLTAVTDEARLDALLRLSAGCADLEAFVAALRATP